jgi:hypothetical protein
MSLQYNQYFTDDGGVIYSWDYMDGDIFRSLDLVSHKDTAHQYYVARQNEVMRRAGVVLNREALISWVKEGGLFPNDAVVEG